jgi:MFS family permease
MAILGITFLVNALGQFYIPAESSAIPLLVRKNQLLAANSLFSITLFASFLIGFGFSGPLIQHLGIDMIFFMGGVMLLAAFALTFYFPKIINPGDEQSRRLKSALKRFDLPAFKEISIIEVKSTFALIRGKVVVMASLLILASVQVAIAILGVLIPSFFEKNLQVNATDASYVLILPLGLGMVLGGIVIGRFGYKLPKRSIVGTSILLAGLLFFLVGAAPLVSPAINYFPKPRPLPFIYQPSLSTTLAIGSFLLGITMVAVVVPSQTVLQENTPDSVRGKVFSILGVLMSALTLFPVVLVGVLADIFGTAPIFIAIGETVVIRIGTAVSASADQITNPSTAGTYSIQIRGAFGDAGGVIVPITSGDSLSVSATVPASTSAPSTGSPVDTGGGGSTVPPPPPTPPPVIAPPVPEPPQVKDKRTA